MVNHLLSKGQQLQTGETFLGIPSISLSVAWLYCIVHCFLPCEVFVYDKDWNSSRKQTANLALSGLISDGLEFLISRRDANIDLYTSSSHNMISKAIKLTAFWLKFAAMSRKRRKRLSDVQSD